MNGWRRSGGRWTAAPRGEGETAEEIDAVPVEAAIDDENVVAEEQEGGGENSDDGNGDNGEAGGVGMGRNWRRKWRKVMGRFELGEELHG